MKILGPNSGKEVFDKEELLGSKLKSLNYLQQVVNLWCAGSSHIKMLSMKGFGLFSNFFNVFC